MSERRQASCLEWAQWCDEEYVRMASWPHGEERSREELLREGRMSMLAELGAALRTGQLPQHCPARSDDLQRQHALARRETSAQ